jgi:hypothetical protein
MYTGQLKNVTVLYKIYYLIKFTYVTDMCLPSFTGIRSRLIISIMSWVSAVSIATGYRLDSHGVGVEALVEARLFPPPCCLDWL